MSLYDVNALGPVQAEQHLIGFLAVREIYWIPVRCFCTCPQFWLASRIDYGS